VATAICSAAPSRPLERLGYPAPDRGATRQQQPISSSSTRVFALALFALTWFCDKPAQAASVVAGSLGA